MSDSFSVRTQHWYTVQDACEHSEEKQSEHIFYSVRIQYWYTVLVYSIGMQYRMHVNATLQVLSSYYGTHLNYSSNCSIIQWQRSRLVWWTEASNFLGGPATFNSCWTSWPARYKNFNKFSLQFVELTNFSDTVNCLKLQISQNFSE